MDLDGNVYSSVVIGDQRWTVENFKCTKYADGTAITNIVGDVAWTLDPYGAYCAYGNDISKKSTYGLLYNYYAVTHVKELAYLKINNVQDTGWRVPSAADYDALITELGGTDVAGLEMKKTDGFPGVIHITTDNIKEYVTLDFYENLDFVKQVHFSVLNLSVLYLVFCYPIFEEILST
jgi:uncharacterized protein (TIGR02145 family)